MKELNDFREFYESSLSTIVNALEEYRKRIVSRIFSYFCGALAVAGSIGMLVLFFLAAPVNIYVNSLVIAGLIGAAIYIYSFCTRDFVHNFKEQVISKVVSFIDESLIFSANNHVSESDFIQSGIFRRVPDRFSGEDLVAGSIGNVRVEFSEAHAQYRNEYWARRRNWYGWTDVRENSWHTIFRGLFLTAYINKRFRARTVVLPDLAESLLGGIGSRLQSLNVGRGQLVKMDDPEFEKAFVVYSDDQIVPRLVLSPGMMKRILEVRRRINRNICLSFAGSKVYIALSWGRNLLEPNVFQTLLNFNLFQQYFQDLQLVTGIVEELKLDEISLKGGFVEI